MGDDGVFVVEARLPVMIRPYNNDGLSIPRVKEGEGRKKI